MTNRSHQPDYFVLDALANDIEGVEDVLRMLNSETELGWAREWGREFTREDVVMALSRLVREDLVRAYVVVNSDAQLKELPPRSLPADGYRGAYFGLTPAGRIVHNTWDPEPGPEA
ncbi:MAG TPA: hypothetical protein VEA99_19215 [Gemmatimonadaceae bacterium]|nr:hypothetical protein [Gemmatimonadaceae bacterium]